jgi:hypothetical protein
MKQVAVRFVKRPEAPRQSSTSLKSSNESLTMTGTVTTVSSRLHAVDVRLENGREIYAARVLTKEWVVDSESPVTGRRDLPPVGARVLVMFPEGQGRPEFAYVLGSLLFANADTPHLPFVEKDKENEEYERSPAGWTETINRETGRIDIQHDGGIMVTVDPETGLTVTDQHGNTVTTADTGVNIGDATETR